MDTESRQNSKFSAFDRLNEPFVPHPLGPELERVREQAQHHSPFPGGGDLEFGARLTALSIELRALLALAIEDYWGQFQGEHEALLCRVSADFAGSVDPASAVFLAEAALHISRVTSGQAFSSRFMRSTAFEELNALIQGAAAKSVTVGFENGLTVALWALESILPTYRHQYGEPKPEVLHELFKLETIWPLMLKWLSLHATAVQALETSLAKGTAGVALLSGTAVRRRIAPDHFDIDRCQSGWRLVPSAKFNTKVEAIVKGWRRNPETIALSRHHRRMRCPAYAARVASAEGQASCESVTHAYLGGVVAAYRGIVTG